MPHANLTLGEMQRSQPWTVPYSAQFERAQATVLPHLYASHTVLHATKTVGKLASVFESLDHREFARATLDDELLIKAMAADLVVAALRLANLYAFDLQAVLCQRVEEKNGIGFRNED
jgi:hypothetical protein